MKTDDKGEKLTIKFADSGIEKSILMKWIWELNLFKRTERIPYEVIRPDFPILSFPKSYQKIWLNKLLAVLVSYRTALLFDLITAKYESMAQYESRFKRIDACMN